MAYFLTITGWLKIKPTACPNFILDTCILGNILNVESLFDITDKSADQYLCDFIAEVAPINLPRCQKCPVKLFCWTCPGELLDINTEAAFNSRCERLKPILISSLLPLLRQKPEIN